METDFAGDAYGLVAGHAGITAAQSLAFFTAEDAESAEGFIEPAGITVRDACDPLLKAVVR
jgi:hypothetical protein